MNRAVLIPLTLFAGGLGTALVLRRDTWRRWSPGLVAVGASWGLWFVLAPDPRFAGVLLWLGGALGLGAALGLPVGDDAQGKPDFPSRLGVLGMVIVLLLGDLPYEQWPEELPRARPERPLNTHAEWVTLSDGSSIIDCTPGITKAGCFNIPCAAIYPGGLRRRDRNDVSRGFVLPPDAGLPHLTME